ncbi:hypothetical protein ACSDIA_001181 [Cronobacter turicensis]|nr:hypothetical protein [Cronobacter turicensis]
MKSHPDAIWLNRRRAGFFIISASFNANEAHEMQDTQRDAGALIFSRLAMFNEAVTLFETQLDPAFWTGFSQCLETFAEEMGWQGEFDLQKRSSCWMSWAKKEEPVTAWFEAGPVENSGNDYFLPLLTGDGVSRSPYGFQFVPDYRHFGGQRVVSARLKAVDQALFDTLGELGFRKNSRGVLFLPVTLDAQLLAQTWQKYGEFAPDDEVFAPLHSALEQLKEAVPHFDKLLAVISEK